MTPDHVCIKCIPTDPEPEMVALCKQGEDGYVSAWVHPRCLFQYRGPASIFESSCIELQLAERAKKGT